MIELTCPWDSKENIDRARNRKTIRYTVLNNDLMMIARSELITLEIGARGFIDKENKSRLSHICKSFRITKIHDFISTVSRLSLVGSHIIWNGRHSPEWTNDMNLNWMHDYIWTWLWSPSNTCCDIPYHKSW